MSLLRRANLPEYRDIDVAVLVRIKCGACGDKGTVAEVVKLDERLVVVTATRGRRSGQIGGIVTALADRPVRLQCGRHDQLEPVDADVLRRLARAGAARTRTTVTMPIRE